MVTDALALFVHDHGEVNKQVIELGAALRELARVDAVATPLVTPLRALREVMFCHFAREEEGLFPFIVDTVPALADRVHAMEVAHDTICGALARMCELAATHANATRLAALFERLDPAYTDHARIEAEVLRELATRLGGDERKRLSALLAGL